MKEKAYLDPKFLKDGLAIFLMNLHRIIIFAFVTLLTSLPILTIGSSFLALSDCMREIAHDGTPNIKYYFKRFKRNLIIGLPYTFIMISIIISLSLAPQKSLFYFFLICGSLLIIFLTLFYPMAGFNQNKILIIFSLSIKYTLIHIVQSLTIVSLALIFLIIIANTSEILLLIFFPIWYFVINRIVIANNLDIEKKEKEKEKINIIKENL